LQKSYVGTYKGSEELGKLVYARAYRMGCERAREVVVMGDGAGWIKTLKGMHFPRAKFILDWWHLKENEELVKVKRVWYNINKAGVAQG